MFAGLLPVTFFSLFSLYRLTGIMVESETEQLIMENERSKDALFQLTFLTDTLVTNFKSEAGLADLLLRHYETEDEGKNAIRSFHDIRTCVNNYPEFTSITVYHENPDFPVYLEFVRETPEIRMLDWYQTAINSYGQNIWFYDSAIESGSYLHMMKYIPLDKDQHIVILFNISNNALHSAFGNEKFTTLLGLNRQTIVYAPSASEIGTVYPYEVPEHSGATAVSWFPKGDSKTLFRNTNLTGINSNEQFQITTFNDCYPYISRITATFLTVLVITLLLPLLFILCFTNMMNKRINTVRSEMHRVASNDFQLLGTVKGKDEFGELYQDIETTMLSIQRLNTELYENRLRQKELENEQNKIQFEALANQINPHFLFNSLESIRMQAAIDGQKELVKIIGNLGKLLRYSLDNRNKTVTLAHELTYLHAYFEIQHFRFPQVNYQIVVDPSLDMENTWLLPLMIQPFVENIFSHSKVTLAQNGIIRISIMRRNNLLFISIYDNGIGISMEKLAEINGYLADPDSYHGKSIGIQNVNKRIRLFYGAKYCVTFDCPKEGGTTATIHIPIRKEFSCESTVY